MAKYDLNTVVANAQKLYNKTPSKLNNIGLGSRTPWHDRCGLSNHASMVAGRYKH